MTYPILLAHGLCPFDLWSLVFGLDNRDSLVLDRLHYWRGVRTMLRARGHQVYHSRVSWGAPIETRADDLRGNISDVLRTTGKDKVNIIAHSMGGLDARRMLFNDRGRGDIRRRIASLTTISTPHLGSSFADWCFSHLGWVARLSGNRGIDLRAVKDLTRETLKGYDSLPDVPAFEKECEEEIQFRTYAGRCVTPRGLLGFSSGIIERREGENDGLVSAHSARWRDRYFRGFIENVDHLNQLGWWSPTSAATGESPLALLKRMHHFYRTLAVILP
jgi:triacylglycerol lipase